MPRDNLPEQEPPPVKKPGFLDRMFDGKSDGRFVKRLLIVMLLIATAVQPISLIYTAYSGHGEFDRRSGGNTHRHSRSSSSSRWTGRSCRWPISSPPPTSRPSS